MKIRLTNDFRVALKSGTVVTVADSYAETLKALGVAEAVTATRKKEDKEDAKQDK